MTRSAHRLAAMVSLLAFAIGGVATTSADWSRFRGPNGSGIDPDDARTAVEWGATANLKWKVELPGAGVSCPIVVSDRVYVTCYSGYGLDRENPGEMKDLKRSLVAVDRKSGKIEWQRTVDPVLPEDPYEGVGVTAHGYASHTPVTDGENVYVFFGKTGAMAFDRDGKQLWHTPLGTESDPRHWGSAASPILYKNLLIVPAIAESEALVALDKKTGKGVWRAAASGFSNSWSTPILVESKDGRTDLVIAVTEEIWGFNPEDGKLRWFCEGAKEGSYCSSLIAQDGIVYAIEGRSGKSMAIRAGGEGDVTKTHVLWTGRDSARFGTPVVKGDRIYSFAGDVASVIDAKTGEKIGRTRLKGSATGGSRGMGGDYSSPILADGKLYYARQSGDIFVVKADDSLEQLAVNRVAPAGEEFSATPAVSDGMIYIRSNKNLYCVAPLGQKVPDAEQVAIAEPEPEDEGEEGEGRGRRGRGRFNPEEFFNENDANKDGKLTGDEIPELLRPRVDDIDSDKDGGLTLEEIQNGMRRGRRGGGDEEEENKRPERPARPPMEK